MESGCKEKNEIQKKFIEYRNRVARVIQKRMVFRITGSNPPKAIQEGLSKRGWLELKTFPWHNIYVQMANISLVGECRPGNEAEEVLISKLLSEHIPDFVWATRPEYYDMYKSVAHLNRIQFNGLNFCGKDQIIKYINKINDELPENEEKIYYARSYLIDTPEDISNFHQQFKLTLISGLILCLYENKPTTKWFCKLNQSVQVEGLDFALRIIEKCIMEFQENSSVTLLNVFIECSQLNHIQWKQIFIAHENIVKLNKQLRLAGEPVKEYIRRINVCAEFLLKHTFRTFHEGYHNVYICKPAWSGEGEGIILMDSHDEIIKLLTEANRRFIVQKYIERPLLIFGTKFDLRQYFLISMDKRHFRGWSHPICSVKFCSKKFTLTDFHEMSHITNTSIQLKYNERSDMNLPEHHMISLSQLNVIFEHMGKSNIYYDVIYPEIKRVLKVFTAASYEHIEHRPGRYQLFGVDWLITEDFKTYLIEINATPSLAYYTPVSNHVIDTILSDMVKATVDYNRDSTADTGGFEIVHEMPLYKNHAAVKTEVDKLLQGNNVECSTSAKLEKDAIQYEVVPEDKNRNSSINMPCTVQVVA